MLFLFKMFTGPVCLVVFMSVTAMAGENSARPEKPNILLVLIDDAGFMDFGVYGGDTATPGIDALAARGAMFSRFYMSPQCGPSRAMLMTGRDNHEVGIGSIPEAMAPAMRKHPGYSMRWPDGLPTIASRLRNVGYQTFITGKWGIGDVGQNLPHRFGFDRSFVIDATGGNNYDQTPYIPLYDKVSWFEDGEPVTLSDDFYSSRSIVDRMINYLDDADPEKPFFSYLSFQAIHIPLQVEQKYRDRYIGRFNEGWDVMRKKRLQRAISLGLVPENTKSGPLPSTSRAWSTLSPEEQDYRARAMQVNAGMLEAADHHLGRLLTYLETSGKLDNTLVIVTSDNGPESSGIGHQGGINGLAARWWLRQTGWNLNYDTLGGRHTMTNIGEEWASVSAAPFKLFKFNASEGGQRVPLVIAGPGVATNNLVKSRAHVIDLVPTILEFVGLDPVADDIRGRSLMPVLSGKSPQVYGENDAVGFEVGGNAALYRGDWKIARIPEPRGNGNWQLYNMATDPGETRDMAAMHPNLFQNMLNEYLHYAREVGVVEVGPSFNPHTQISKNILVRMLQKYWPQLLFTGFVLLCILFLLIRLSGRLLKHFRPG